MRDIFFNWDDADYVDDLGDDDGRSFFKEGSSKKIVSVCFLTTFCTKDIQKSCETYDIII